MKFKKQLLLFATGFYCATAFAQVGTKLPTKEDVELMAQANRQIPIAIPAQGQTAGQLLNIFDRGQAQQNAPAPKAKGKDLMVFVSASMPPETIKNYSRQASEYGAVMVLRGFVKGKMSETRSLVEALNEGGAEWMIQPQAFKLFKVDRVPSIVLSLPTNGSVTEEGCAPESEYIKITGDVGIGPALNAFSSKAAPDLSSAAKQSIAEYQAKYAPARLR